MRREAEPHQRASHQTGGESANRAPLLLISNSFAALPTETIHFFINNFVLIRKYKTLYKLKIEKFQVSNNENNC